MENIFKYKGLIIALVASIAFGVVIAPGCREKVAVKPVVVVVKDTLPTVVADTVAQGDKYWVCKTITDQLPDSLRQKRAVAQKGKQWPQKQVLTVQLQTTNAEQIADFKRAAQDWANECNVTFTYPATGPYKIRCAFANSGAWSYVGSDCASIPQSSPTMNIGFRDGGSYYPVIIHELGHALSLLHEHQNPNNPPKYNEPVVLADLQGSPNFWTVEQIHFNVLDPWKQENVISTSRDDLSVMMYNQPGRWFLNGIAIAGGKVLSPVDKSFINTLYPKANQPPPPPPTTYTVTKAQRDNLKRITSKAKAATDAAKIANDSLSIINAQIFGAN